MNRSINAPSRIHGRERHRPLDTLGGNHCNTIILMHGYTRWDRYKFCSVSSTVVYCTLCFDVGTVLT